MARMGMMTIEAVETIGIDKEESFLWASRKLNSKRKSIK